MIGYHDTHLRAFVAESNRIEGTIREPTDDEMRAHADFLRLEEVGVDNLQQFVAAVQPGATLRSAWGMNVRVGDHWPPHGGPEVETLLRGLLGDIARFEDPFSAHRRYETLHPFMDGNGRSGRILWLWQMFTQLHDMHVMRRGFLHSWYYQSLSSARA